MEVETFTFVKEVSCAGADNIPIRVGDVLKEINDGEVGVVTNILREGDRATTPCCCVGDVRIQTSVGCTRCTNRYNQWTHVPHDEQTYEQRYLSWRLGSDSGDPDNKDGLAISGILALLPEDTVDWDYGEFPDDIETTLKYLVSHLSELSKQEK